MLTKMETKLKNNYVFSNVALTFGETVTCLISKQLTNSMVQETFIIP